MVKVCNTLTGGTEEMLRVHLWGRSCLSSVSHFVVLQVQHIYSQDKVAPKIKLKFAGFTRRLTFKVLGKYCFGKWWRSGCLWARWWPSGLKMPFWLSLFRKIRLGSKAPSGIFPPCSGRRCSRNNCRFC